MVLIKERKKLGSGGVYKEP